jgi:acetyl esterase/lipase
MTEPFVRPDVCAHLDAAKAMLRPRLTIEGRVAARPMVVRAYPSKTIAAGVPTTYIESPGIIHGFASLRKAIPSGQQDIVNALEVAQMTMRHNL